MPQSREMTFVLIVKRSSRAGNLSRKLKAMLKDFKLESAWPSAAVTLEQSFYIYFIVCEITLPGYMQFCKRIRFPMEIIMY